MGVLQHASPVGICECGGASHEWGANQGGLCAGQRSERVLVWDGCHGCQGPEERGIPNLVPVRSLLVLAWPANQKG